MSSILSIQNLFVDYRTGKGSLRAVSGVSFDLEAGSTLGLVGESGCGKSSLIRAVIGLVPCTGKVMIDGVDIFALKGEEKRTARRKIQMVFQDPYGSLDPHMNVSQILSEPLLAHGIDDSVEILKLSKSMLDLVALPQSALVRYPHEFSGGQRQRIAIARALMLKPRVLLADEPVSSLDVSVQAQILNLLKDLQRELGLSMIFVTHNLAVVKYIAKTVSVMYLGKIVESGDVRDICLTPKHPYTKALVSAVPVPDPVIEKTRQRIMLKGEIPSPIHLPSGCAFHTRCPIMVSGKCDEKLPKLEKVGANFWQASCFEIHPYQSN